MNKLVQTFLDLAAIDEMYPNEKQVLEYIGNRLSAAGATFENDPTGNIITRIPADSDETLAICGHVDVAAPLYGRRLIVKDGIISTDGKGLLGGDDKTAVAAMIELVDEIAARRQPPRKSLELIFTVGEENNLDGSRGVKPGSLRAKDMLVFDWLGAVNNIILRSPARYALDVTFVGKDAHPAQWQLGRNAGAALMEAASGLRQGDYAADVIFTIGIVQIGDARNKVPGTAAFKAEMRSYDPVALEAAAANIEDHLIQVAEKHEVQPRVTFIKDPNAFTLDQESDLYHEIVRVSQDMGLQPNLEETFARFDGNSFAAHGINVAILGAAYHNPHSPEETVNIQEFEAMYDFICRICL